MDRAGIVVEGRVVEDEVLVHSLAVRQPADAVTRAGSGLMVDEGIQEAHQRGLDMAPERGRDPLPVRCREVRVGDEERRLLGGCLQHAAHLRDRPLERDGRRRASGLAALLEVREVRVDERGVGPEPGDQPLDALGRVHALETRQLPGERLGAGHLVHGLEVPQVQRCGLLPHPGDQPHDVERDPLFHVQSGRIDGGSVLQHGGDERRLHSATGRGRIIPAVGARFITQHRGPQRAQVQDPGPEPVGQSVDGYDFGHQLLFPEVAQRRGDDARSGTAFRGGYPGDARGWSRARRRGAGPATNRRTWRRESLNRPSSPRCG